MAPGPSQKGTSKKNSAVMPKASRTGTPAPAPSSLPPQQQYDPEYLHSRVITLRDITYEDLVDQSSLSAGVPDLRLVDAMLQKLNVLTDLAEKRSAFYDRGMRYLVEERKRRPVEEPEPETKKKHKRKKGTDALAPSDANLERSSPLKDSKRKHSRERSASSSLSPVAAGSPSAMDVDEKEKKPKKDEEEKPEDDESSSEEEEAPPKREVPAHQTFGDDPSTFPDPTVYEIREVTPGMSEREKKEIYSVVTYPKSDLADMIAGDPPDMDFSQGKATNQINFSTFSTSTEPFFRLFNEEDLAFLRERGDRVTPFMMPARGKRHYTEIWAEEDGAMSIDSPQQGREKLPPNQPRGNIDNMTDTLGETDQLSIGPLASRLLQALRPENRGNPAEDKPATNGSTTIATNGAMNGDLSMTTDFGLSLDDPFAIPPMPEAVMPLPSATYMFESATEAWKKASHPKLDYAQVDERLKQELKYLGFLPEDGFEPNYNDHLDDEVAARLRLLQGRLKEQMLINGARKAKLMELVRERMAHQEYQTILEDLDSQVQAAYLKRTRTMGKSKKTKRPGGAGGGSHAVGGGMARPGIGDLTKTLMERRKRWVDTIGPVFDAESLTKVPREQDGDTSIFFKADEMAALMQKEQEAWDEEVEVDEE